MLLGVIGYSTVLADVWRFGLPKPRLRMTTSLFQEVVYEATVNQQYYETTIFLKTESGYLLPEEGYLRRSRIVIPEHATVIEYGGQRFIPIGDIAEAQVKIDDAQSEVSITMPAEVFVSRDLQGETRASIAKPERGAFINYDLFAQKYDGIAQYDGRFELGMSNQYGMGQVSLLARDVSRAKELTRLETTWTVDRPDEMVSWRIGDAINRGGSVGRPIRFGGIQFGTNFATQPEFVAFPQFSLRGSAALPSTVDLYINNVRTFSQQVTPGPFSINNLPVLTGSGEARLVVRDMFGREQFITQPYYASRSLLKKGLADYSYESGFERFNYGFTSDDYRDWFASGTHRFGLSDQLTVEGHAELKTKQATGSLSAVFLIPRTGVLDATVALSNSSQYAQGAGQLGALGFERQTSNWSYGVHTQLASKGFRQLGLPDFISAPARLNTVFMAWHKANFGSLSMNYIDQQNRELASARLFSINYSRTIFNDWFINLNVFKNLESDQGHTLGFSLVKALDARTSGSVFMNQSRDYQETIAQVQQALPYGEGFGYRGLVSRGDAPREEIGLNMQNDVGTYSVEAASRNQVDAYRAMVSGGVVFAGGNAIFTRRLGDGYAIVDAGYPGVRVYAENHLIGKTDRNGMRVIPNLRSYQRNRIAIDPDDIPFEAQIDATMLEVSPYYRSVSYLKFPVRKEKAATVYVVQRDGKPVPTGAIFTNVKDDAVGFPVSENGLLFMKYLEKNNRFIGRWKGGACELEVTYPDTNDPLPDLGKVACR